jgi:hypothetical protein
MLLIHSRGIPTLHIPRIRCRPNAFIDCSLIRPANARGSQPFGAPFPHRRRHVANAKAEAVPNPHGLMTEGASSTAGFNHSREAMKPAC